MLYPLSATRTFEAKSRAQTPCHLPWRTPLLLGITEYRTTWEEWGAGRRDLMIVRLFNLVRVSLINKHIGDLGTCLVWYRNEDEEALDHFRRWFYWYCRVIRCKRYSVSALLHQLTLSLLLITLFHLHQPHRQQDSSWERLTNTTNRLVSNFLIPWVVVRT